MRFLLESCELHLSPDDIAIAEGCGISFVSASSAQVQRFAMQRKVFYANGKAMLATRGDGLYETVGTLQQLIDVGRRERLDLAAWQLSGLERSEEHNAPAPVRPEGAGQRPEPQSDAPAEPPHPAADLMQDERPRRQERRRRSGATSPERAAETLADAPQASAASSQAIQPAAPQHAVETVRAAQRGGRWLVAGAARRGRAAKHWSMRQR